MSFKYSLLSDSGTPSNESRLSTEPHVQQMRQGQSNILVSVRCRPLHKREQSRKATVQIIDQHLLVLKDHAHNKEKQFAFDLLFDEFTSQQSIFEKTTHFLLEGVASGYNATVFAYGATGAGKTYTMLGESDHPGLMNLTFDSLFSTISNLSKDKDYSVKISYLEIYNEVLRDLLNPMPFPIDIREDPFRGIQISGLTEVVISSPLEVLSLLKEANSRRTTEPTEANSTSSRSHAILQVMIGHQDRAPGIETEIITGKLCLVDLAGSERGAKTSNRGLRMIEGASINRSLLALGTCINALSENKKVHVPYRNSKLTRLLKDSLGGNCRTVMIACISPSSDTYEDTHNTLVYANRAKSIRTSVKRNVLNANFHINKYTELIQSLRNQVLTLRGQISGENNIEQFQVEINTLFKTEARSRTQMFKLQQSKALAEFELFAKKTENRPSQEYERLYQEINKLNSEETEIASKIKRIVKERDNFKQKWKDLPDNQRAVLNRAVEQQIQVMQSLEQNMENEQEIKHSQFEYIKYLKEQVRARDVLLDDHKKLLEQKCIKMSPALLRGYKELRNLDVSLSNLPSIHRNCSVNREQTRKYKNLSYAENDQDRSSLLLRQQTKHISNALTHRIPRGFKKITKNYY